MNKCQHCGGRAQLYLCQVHIRELRTMLDDLITTPDQHGRPRAGLLAHLAGLLETARMSINCNYRGEDE